MKEIYYITTPNSNVIVDKFNGNNPNDLVFSNGNTEYQPIMFLKLLDFRIDKGFYIIPGDELSGFVQRKDVINYLINTQTNYIKYKKTNLQGVFTVGLYFCSYFNPQKATNEIMYSLVSPGFNSPFSTVTRKEPSTELNPRLYLKYLPRRYNMSISYLHGYNQYWNCIKSDFLEFWVNERFDPKNAKSLEIGMRADKLLSSQLVTYFRECGVKILYKTADEMNTLTYKAKIEAHSIDELNIWKQNMTQKTVDSFYKPVKTTPQLS